MENPVVILLYSHIILLFLISKVPPSPSHMFRCPQKNSGQGKAAAPLAAMLVLGILLIECSPVTHLLSPLVWHTPIP